MDLQFYIPERHLPPAEEMPFWLEGEPRKPDPPGKASTSHNWILLTYARLRKHGIRVGLVHEWPVSGIVLALTGSLAPGFVPPKELFVVGIAADGNLHSGCHLHIVQNASHANRTPGCFFIPHWSQPGLIPRDPSRKETFQNVCFFGDPPNLAPELRIPDFAREMKERLDLEFRIIGYQDWADYSFCDATLAIREFGNRPFLRKPGTKLYNAWLAGVPLIGGSDIAFLDHGKPGVDYLRCETPEQVLTALQTLRDRPDLRQSIVVHGREAGRRFTPQAVLKCWTDFLQETVIPEAEKSFTLGPMVRFGRRRFQSAIVRWDSLRGSH